MKKFLVIQLARFGDLVQTKRLIKSLEMRGEVHLCIDNTLAELAKLIYPNTIIHTLPAHFLPSAQGLMQVHNALVQLNTYSFDAVYNLNHAGLNRALARFFEVEQVIGYQMHGAQAVHSPWVRKAFTWTQNRIINPINLVDFWAFFDEFPCSPQKVNPKAIGGGKGIGVVLAGRESRRSIPPADLALIIRTFFEVNDAPHIYLLGTKAENVLAKQLMRHMPVNMLDKISNLSGKTSWSELIDTLQGLDILISPDTGTMHLAAHLGVPVQAFFLSSAWCHETGPYGEGHSVWQSVYTCAPCLESVSCPINTKCLEDFTTREFLHGLNCAAMSLKKNDSSMKNNSIVLPNHIVNYTSVLDTFGSTWQVNLGKDIYAKRRLGFRATLAEQCGFALKNVSIPPELADIFYDEADWILGQNSKQMILITEK